MGLISDGCGSIVASDAATTTLVTLRLDVGTETISGTVAAERCAERRFWGWLQLSDALDRMRGFESGEEDPPRVDAERPHEVH